MASARVNWIDRAISTVSPALALRRVKTRIASEMLQRHFEGAATGRRTQGWKRPSSDVNAAQSGLTLAHLRNAARDLVRNNPFAESALDTIAQHAIGSGIMSTEDDARWRKWSETTACDADGQENLAGLQKLVMRATAESGEVLIRRRWRRPEDKLPLPFQLQVLEADMLDTSATSSVVTRPGMAPGNRIIQGVEFNGIGQRVAYWIFREHPGSLIGNSLSSTSVRIPAADVLHVFKRNRPGQVRGASWFASVLLRFKDFDEFEDATLMKQKIAACLSVLTSDPEGTDDALGTTSTAFPEIDTLEPGMIAHLPGGRSIDVIQPPSVTDYEPYTKTQQRAIATGLGVTYEDMTGDYTNLPYSAARMSRLRHYAKVDDWQWRLIVPQMLNPIWEWAREAAEFTAGPPLAESTDWTTPSMPMLEPDKEGLAFIRNVRGGATTISEGLRQIGYNPKKFLKELAADMKLLDELGLILDSDPRKMTQAGQLQGSAAASGAKSEPTPSN